MSEDINTLSVRSKSVSEEILYPQTEEEVALQGMDQYRVRRLSCRNLQLPPLAFRQLEQADWDRKADQEMVSRPTSLPMRTLPLIAITAAETVRVAYALKISENEDDCNILNIKDQGDEPSDSPAAFVGTLSLSLF